MNKEAAEKKKLPLWRRIAFLLIVLAIAGLAAIMLTDYIVSKSLDNRIITIQRAGHPVSFEHLRSATAAASQEDVSSLYTSVISNLPTSDPEELTRAISSYRNTVAAGMLDRLRPEHIQLIENILNQNKSLMIAFDKAATLPVCEFDIGIKHGREACARTLAQSYKALSLVSLRTVFLIASKDYDKAAKSVVTMLKATRIFDAFPTIIVSGTKQHFIQLACDDIRILLIQGKLDEPMLDELTNALTEAMESGTIKDSLLAEQVYQISVSRNLFSKGVTTDVLPQNDPDIPERAGLPESSLRRIKLRWFVSQYFKAMNNLIEFSGKSNPDLFQYVSDQKKSISGKLNQAFEGTHAFIENSFITSAALKSTILMLYVEKYRCKNGHVPDSLADITEQIDPVTMIDPYTGNSMFYKKDEQSYTIYSTGPDKTDNAGAINANVSQKTGEIERMPDDIGLGMLIPKEP